MEHDQDDYNEGKLLGSNDINNEGNTEANEGKQIPASDTAPHQYGHGSTSGLTDRTIATGESSAVWSFHSSKSPTGLTSDLQPQQCHQKRQQLPPTASNTTNLVQVGPEVGNAANATISFSHATSGFTLRPRAISNPDVASYCTREVSMTDPPGLVVDPRSACTSPASKNERLQGTNESAPTQARFRTYSNPIPTFHNYHRQNPFSRNLRQRQRDAQLYLRNARIDAPTDKVIVPPPAGQFDQNIVHDRFFEPAQNPKEVLVGIMYGGRKENGQRIMREILNRLLAEDGDSNEKYSPHKGKRKASSRAGKRAEQNSQQIVADHWPRRDWVDALGIHFGQFDSRGQAQISLALQPTEKLEAADNRRQEKHRKKVGQNLEEEVLVNTVDEVNYPTSEE